MTTLSQVSGVAAGVLFVAFGAAPLAARAEQPQAYQPAPQYRSDQATQPSPPKVNPAAGTPAQQFKARPPAPSRAVLELQQALNRNGAAIEVDGIMGPDTRAALRRYQSANGLPANGQYDAATRAKLGI
jgi:peptidoglycan hydrolase-like protein with peptidoglycan-binding domain